MKNKIIITLFALVFFAQYIFSSPNFTEWSTACDQLPYFRKNPQNSFVTPLTREEFEATLRLFIIKKAAHLHKSALWESDAPTLQDPFFKKPHLEFKPFVQRLIVPAHSKVSFHGDLHGDVHSLITYLKKLENKKTLINFKIQDPDFYLIFLGDYVDRGHYGAETMYTLLRLKIENPTQVFLIRGNHEDLSICTFFGFGEELRRKFTDPQNLLAQINHVYNVLPVALYLGCNHSYLQCCHGGMEVGFNTHSLLDAPETPLLFQWLGDLTQKTACQHVVPGIFDPVAHLLQNKKPQQCFDVGFMWNDFEVDPLKAISYDHQRGFCYNKKSTLTTLKLQSTARNKVYGVMRAHQHTTILNPMMQSILHVDNLGRVISAEKNRRGLSTLWDVHNKGSKLWEGIVCTLLVSPDTPYGLPNKQYPGFNYDAYAVLTTDEKFENWDLRVFRNHSLPTH